MKRILLLVACIMLSACKKESIGLVIGNYYTVKDNIFNKGVYQPVCPCRLDSLYIAPNGLPYAEINGGQTGAKIGSSYNKDESVEWYLPQDDLH